MKLDEILAATWLLFALPDRNVVMGSLLSPGMCELFRLGFLETLVLSRVACPASACGSPSLYHAKEAQPTTANDGRGQEQLQPMLCSVASPFRTAIKLAQLVARR